MPDQHTDRPTAETADVVLSSLDQMIGQLSDRIEGSTDDEYLWEPVTEMWSVRPRDGGSIVVDGAGERDVDPAPTTTIAWRMWHLSVDCLDDYTRRLRGDGRDLDPDDEWFLEVDRAIDALGESWERYRSEIAGRSDWWDELGPAWGPWSRHSLVDMALHADNELTHHGAEIALLRDLHRGQGNA